jgi:branched-chain amino acid transport system substrate-binding protein
MQKQKALKLTAACALMALGTASFGQEVIKIANIVELSGGGARAAGAAGNRARHAQPDLSSSSPKACAGLLH